MSHQIHVMIIGVEKAGTTALFRHLAQSPKIYAHPQREMFGFLSDEEYERGWGYIWEKYFFGYEDGVVLAKNVMEINSEISMARLKMQCPDVKCIVMLREPASRAYSAYNYAVSRGAERCSSFEEALKCEGERYKSDPRPNNPLLYIRNSTYAQRLDSALNIFGKENVLVLYHEEYKDNPRTQLRRVENFLGTKLFERVEINFISHNGAAKARYPWLARIIYGLLQSRNPVKRSLRKLLPHNKAVKLRHTLLNFNRIEAPYVPMNEETALFIRRELSYDADRLERLVGFTPWLKYDL